MHRPPAFVLFSTPYRLDSWYCSRPVLCVLCGALPTPSRALRSTFFSRTRQLALSAVPSTTQRHRWVTGGIPELTLDSSSFRRFKSGRAFQRPRPLANNGRHGVLNDSTGRITLHPRSTPCTEATGSLWTDGADGLRRLRASLNGRQVKPNNRGLGTPRTAPSRLTGPPPAAGLQASAHHGPLRHPCEFAPAAAVCPAPRPDLLARVLLYALFVRSFWTRAVLPARPSPA